MNKKEENGKIIFEQGRKPWPHEIHTARVLAQHNYTVIFLNENKGNMPDILLDGIEFEIKAPKTAKISSLEQVIRKALKQSPNIIIDSFRMKIRDDASFHFLVKTCRLHKQIKQMIFINKKEEIVDIFDYL